VSELFAATCSIAPTKRKRFFWAAWWSAPPARVPFRKPDAANGGAASREEALLEAERAAGRSLVTIDAAWARAFMRSLRGQPLWPTPEAPKRAAAIETKAPLLAWHRVLGVFASADEDAIKQAYRKLVLEHHPDRGGESERFRLVQRAYETAMARRERPRRKKRP
jgi:hypothetical protein